MASARPRSSGRGEWFGTHNERKDVGLDPGADSRGVLLLLGEHNAHLLLLGLEGGRLQQHDLPGLGAVRSRGVGVGSPGEGGGLAGAVGNLGFGRRRGRRIASGRPRQDPQQTDPVRRKEAHDAQSYTDGERSDETVTTASLTSMKALARAGAFLISSMSEALAAKYTTSGSGLAPCRGEGKTPDRSVRERRSWVGTVGTRRGGPEVGSRRPSDAARTPWSLASCFSRSAAVSSLRAAGAPWTLRVGGENKTSRMRE